MNKKGNNESFYLDDSLRVSLLHKQLLDEISDSQVNQIRSLSNAIYSSEELLSSLGYPLPDNSSLISRTPVKVKAVVPVKSWDDILDEAKRSTPEKIDFNALLTQSEIDAVLREHASIGGDLDWFSSFDRYDFALSVATGVIAGVIDVLLVGVPAHPGFLGSQASEGGWLSHLMKEKTGNLFSKEKIKELEKYYSVSYDPSTNSKLHEKVVGLGSRTHRFQSLGHDPFLGFIFGVRDILTGEFSAIGKDGCLVTQQIADPLLQGEQLFVRLFEVLKTQFGHLASDIATPSGLPAPLMPLLLFLQFGEIGNKKYTIGEVSRQMYRSGYDFRHFIAGSIPVILTEIIIRLGYFVKSIKNGKTLAEAIPSASSIKLRRQLLIAHSVATLINAGKVYVTQNPLAISWAQALAFLRYIMPELSFLLFGKEAARSKLVEEEIINNYQVIDNEINQFLKTQGDFLLMI
jgi:hypothetical protein